MFEKKLSYWSLGDWGLWKWACLKIISRSIFFFSFFFSFFFLSWFFIFTVYRTAGERRGYFFSSFLPFPLASQTLRHSQAITAEILPLNLVAWLEPVSKRKSQITKLRALNFSSKYLISSQAQNQVTMLKKYCKIPPKNINDIFAMFSMVTTFSCFFDKISF